ncbi:NADPH-dependent FMN reductase [Streptomyces sp. NPDC049555]|uniref:NADPH-dependent FMN reductase n=1 Tax=Streptomyces sp. NPDC049555 TaxID=3154930 RepID=UPI00341D18D1
MPTSEVLLISGSLRAGSSNETALRTAQAVAPEGIRTVLYEGLASLPHFNPDDDHDPLPAPVAEMRAAVASATAVLICTPEYAGTLPGAFKNLLDWTVGGTEICDKPVAWLNVAPPGRGGGASATLRTVLGYTGAAIVDQACVQLPVGRETVGPDGTVTDPAVRERLRELLATLVAASPEQL